MNDKLTYGSSERKDAAKHFETGDRVCFWIGSNRWDDDGVARGRVVEVRGRSLVVDTTGYRMVVPSSDAWLEAGGA